MHLIVGLGNPGQQYAANRHNVGAMAVDAIAREHQFPPFRSKFKGLFADGRIGKDRVLLLKPQTYMNHSGDAVQAAAAFYKLSPQDITVIHDELDLAPGKVRIRTGGGNGGHNGLRSIDPQIGRDYQRVRIGIGHPGSKAQVNRHVLSDFHKADHEWLDPVLQTIGQNAQMLVSGDGPGLMNRLALALQRADAGTKGNNAPPPAGKQGKTRNTERAEKAPDQTSNEGPLAGMLKKLFKQD